MLPHRRLFAALGSHSGRFKAAGLNPSNFTPMVRFFHNFTISGGLHVACA
jgi:hypothetical protein